MAERDLTHYNLELYIRTVSFRVLIGSGSSSCEQADNGEDVVLQYRPASSSNFTQMKFLAHNGVIAMQLWLYI